MPPCMKLLVKNYIIKFSGKVIRENLPKHDNGDIRSRLLLFEKFI